MLLSRGVLTILTSVGLVAVSVATLEVGLPAAVAAGGDDPGFGAILVALPALGSAVGGLAYGTRVWSGAPVPRYLVALTLILVLLVPLPIVAPFGPVLLAVLLVLAGLPMAPASIEEFTFLGRLADVGRNTEVFAWSVTTMAAATAAGNTLAGWLSEAVAPFVALALAPAASAGALLVVVVGSRDLSHRLRLVAARELS